MTNTIATLVSSIAALLTSIAVLLGVFRVYKKVDGLASSQAERIDQLSGLIAGVPGVDLPERLPSGEPPPESPPKDEPPNDEGHA